MKLKRHFSHYRNTKSRKRTLSENMRRMHHFFVGFCVLMSVSAGALSLWSNAHQATQAYRLRELQAQYENLQEESRRLNHFMLQAQSLNQLELSEESSAMNKEDSLYLNLSDYAQVIPQ